MINRVKHIIWIFLLIGLLLPLIQKIVPFYESKPLNGSQEQHADADFTWNGFFDGSYQKKKEDHLIDSIGFKNEMVRINNQMAYSLFNIPRAKSIVLGEDEYFYEQTYIEEYNGLNFIGNDSIKYIVNRLSEFRDVIEEKGKELLFVIAPGKASFYPEYIPKPFSSQEGENTNYKSYSKYLSLMEINTIDFRSYFNSIKNVSKYPLVPQTGIHWSFYGQKIAIDSIISYIENKFNYDLPNTILDTLLIGPPEKNDIDLEKAFNLFFTIGELETAIPKFHFESKKGKDTVSCITISDSFYWQMFNKGMSNKCFTNGKFWYYNKRIYPDFYKNNLRVNEVNVWEKIEDTDVVMFLLTEANFSKFPFDFFKELDKNPLEINYVKEREKKITSVIKRIRNDEKWFSKVKEQANENRIGVDKMILLSANHIVKKEFPELYSLTSEQEKTQRKKMLIEACIKRIKNDEKWLYKIENQALVKGFKIDEMFYLSAAYVVLKENPELNISTKRQIQIKKIEQRIEQCVKRIKKNKKWFGFVKKKATEQNKRIEEILYQDARYVVDQDLKKEATQEE